MLIYLIENREKIRGGSDSSLQSEGSFGDFPPIKPGFWVVLVLGKEGIKSEQFHLPFLL